jgi:hypothetical protein
MTEARRLTADLQQRAGAAPANVLSAVSRLMSACGSAEGALP